MMYGRGKSSPDIVARKPANKAEPKWVAAAAVAMIPADKHDG
jgi:hypothetical protein